MLPSDKGLYSETPVRTVPYNASSFQESDSGEALLCLLTDRAAPWFLLSRSSCGYALQVLQEAFPRGSVTVAARAFLQDTTSHGAAGLWEPVKLGEVS